MVKCVHVHIPALHHSIFHSQFSAHFRLKAHLLPRNMMLLICLFLLFPLFQPAMDESSSSTASTSTAANPDHEVFINHLGSDVKKTLASHLYNGLSSNGLKPFLDCRNCEQGEYFFPQIESAIRLTPVHLAIFSVNYANSVWCLKELVLMRESMMQSNACTIPIFYRVKPSDLRVLRRDIEYGRCLPKLCPWTRGQIGTYRRYLRKMEKGQIRDPQTGSRLNPEIIEDFRTALTWAAGIQGFELETFNGDEGMLLSAVIKRVKAILGKRVKPADGRNVGEDILPQQRASPATSNMPLPYVFVNMHGNPDPTPYGDINQVDKTSDIGDRDSAPQDRVARRCSCDNAGKGPLISSERMLPINSVQEVDAKLWIMFMRFRQIASELQSTPIT